jgi:hypothetical protein
VRNFDWSRLTPSGQYPQSPGKKPAGGNDRRSATFRKQ